MTSRETLFVYGSFCQGMVHFKKLEQYIVAQGPAVARGSVYRLSVGYPVFLNAGDHAIAGQWVEIEAPDLVFRLMDEFHGFSPIQPEKSLFQKMTIEVQCGQTQQTKTVKAYCLTPSRLPRNSELISDGDWRRQLDEKPALPTQLTERQATYVRRLGASTGRDIVPIDLELYRELLKLDLIIDKGRRLALTKLGKDVYRYLPE